VQGNEVELINEIGRLVCGADVADVADINQSVGSDEEEEEAAAAAAAKEVAFKQMA